MSHKLKVGQAVVPAFREMDGMALYQIVRLMPLCFLGQPQYMIRCRRKGAERLVRETEIKGAFA
jgi:hypothetical protein